MLTTWLACLGLVVASLQGSEPDSDGDGLSDFQEVHKYGTDPSAADSDGDGTPDGGWLERREYAYTVRSVVQVMEPVTPVTIDGWNDDFQDARVLHEGEDWVELEVVCYPFGTANDAIEGERDWSDPEPALRRWLAPGPTSNGTPALRAELLAALRADGIDVAVLDDREVVERVSAWLLRRTETRDGFTTFLTSFDADGRLYVDAELRDAAAAGLADTGLSLEEQWQRELSARGMYEHGTRGSCTSSAIYLSGCLRAVGIPTRTVLCIPLIDANDERERALAETRLTHPEVRRIVTECAEEQVGSWTSHTLNEVWVGGRWRRLNYDRLGQGVLDRDWLGLMTHVATFHDWADAHAAETIGRRHGTRTQRELFGGPNPYSTISLSDASGEHCDRADFALPERRLVVRALRWTDDPELREDVRTGCERSGRFGLIAIVEGLEGSRALRSFLAGADLRVDLVAPGHPRIATAFDPGCWWYRDGVAWIYLPFGAADVRDLVSGVEYAAVPRNRTEGFVWEMELRVTR